MIYQQDWLMRQIEAMIQAVLKKNWLQEQLWLGITRKAS